LCSYIGVLPWLRISRWEARVIRVVIDVCSLWESLREGAIRRRKALSVVVIVEFIGV